MDKNFSDAKDIIFARFRLSLTNIELRYLKKISDEVYRQIETESRQAREAVERGGRIGAGNGFMVRMEIACRFLADYYSVPIGIAKDILYGKNDGPVVEYVRRIQDREHHFTC